MNKKFVFFDIESISFSGGAGQIASFGYVITSSRFKVLEARDILINPLVAPKEYNWKLVKKMFSYSVAEVKNSPPFSEYYDFILWLLTSPDYIVFGFASDNDYRFLMDDCTRFKLKKFNLKVFDVQRAYKKFSEGSHLKGLSKIVQELEIKTDELKEHNSQDDALVTMRVFEKICKKLNKKPREVLGLYEDAFRCFSPKDAVRVKEKKTHAKTLKNRPKTKKENK